MGVHPVFYVKLVFEIAVAQQTRTRYQTFESTFWLNYAKSSKHIRKPIFVASGLLKSCIKLHLLYCHIEQKWLSY